MTTPNEELIERLKGIHDRQQMPTLLKAANLLQSQAERIKELETVPMKYRRMQFNAELQEENARLRAQLAESISNHEACKSANSMLLDEIAEIEKTEPVCLIPDYELDYMQTHACGAVYKVGSDEACDNDADIKLFTRPMPADVTELVEALEQLARLGNGEHYGNSDGNMIARDALSKYKGEK